MNCFDCQENLVAFLEGMLDPQTAADCRQHLDDCPVCRAAREATFKLQQQLLKRGQAAAQVSLVVPVMSRVLQNQKKTERETIISTILKYRWRFGFGAAAGAAAILIAIIVAMSPRAFGIDQVIEAYNKIRFLHVKTFGVKSQEPAEFWIQSNDQGQVEKARYYLPETEDGVKLITWTPQKAEIWFMSKHGFLILQTKRIAPWMQSLLEQSQPQLVMKKLQEGQKAGKIDVQTQEPPGDQKSAVIVATHKTEPTKEIYYVDRKTDLITRIEYYHIEGTNEVLESRTEFSDYNVPIEEKMFSLQDQLPKDVTVADQLNQVIGVAQGTMTDEQAAAETVRQFFQALMDKDYKKAGLIYGGELEEHFKEQFGALSVAGIIAIGPAVAQTNWVKHGFRVPCKLELLQSDGQKIICQPSPYVRPGDDETHPDRWNITGGVNLGGTEVKILPDNAKYEKMTPRQAAETFFKACAEKQWDEVLKFCPMSGTDERFERMKEYLGGLEIVSLGEPYQTGEYPGWYVPYEIKFPRQEFNVRVSNTNLAKRCVVTGVYDSKLRLLQEIKWSIEPEILTNNDVYARLSPTQAVQAYFDAQSKLDWVEMLKFTSESDVADTKNEVEMAGKRGMDVHKLMPVIEVGEATWSPEQSAWFVKYHMSQTRKWNLVIRKDNPAGRWQFDGGL